MLSALPGGLVGARYGSPPAEVVALHGWRRSHADWDTVLAGLDASAPDLPGFGGTKPPDGPWGALEYAEAVLPLCETDQVVLVGHSFGGKVAVMLAAAHPERVKALVLTGVPLFLPAGQRKTTPTAAYRAARWLNGRGLLSDERMERRRQASGSDDYRNATGVMREVFVRSIAEVNDGTYRRALADIRCPVELVWGAGDTAAPPRVAEEAVGQLHDAHLTILDGVGHLTPTEAPAALREAVERHG
jgi:pimeloyl-ACP methyl ester carboxylesterase